MIEEKIEKELNTMSWGKAFKWCLVFMLFSLFIAVVGGLFSTIGSVATAPGKVIQKTMDTNNIIQSYEWFYDVNAAYQAKIGQINQFKTFYEIEENPQERSRLRIEMAAIQQTCRDLVEKYNANSFKVNKSIFKGWSLPDTLNQPNCG